MYEKKYEVYVDGKVVADDMTLDYATILIKGIFNEYYNDTNMTVAIKEMDQTQNVCADDTKVWRAE